MRAQRKQLRSARYQNKVEMLERNQRHRSTQRPNADRWQIESLERAKGIEPSYEAWEASVLPLNYARKVTRLYFNSLGYAA